MFKQHKKTIQGVSEALADGFEAIDLNKFSSATRLITGALTLDWHFWPLSNKIVIKDKEQEWMWSVVLVFDDLERFIADNDSADMLYEILGFINDFSENKNFKVLVLANEKEIPSDIYRKIKEKVIALTLRYESDMESIFEEIISKYKDIYKRFLSTQKRSILSSFDILGKKNIRSLINGLAFFERIYHMLVEMSFEYIGNVLINFLNIYYLNCQGVKVISTFDSLPYDGLLVKYSVHKESNGEDADIEKENREATIYTICADKFFVRSLAVWIEKGCFDKQAFNSDIKKIIEEQKPKDQVSIPAYEQILKGWSLDAIPDEELIPAFSDALKKAYQGETNFDGYISIIAADTRLNVLGITYETVDWIAFDEGLSKYINNIEATGDFESVKKGHRQFITEETLKANVNENAVCAYRKMESYNASARKNRKELIGALTSGDVSTAIMLSQQKIFEGIDDEMCEAFLGVYQNAVLAYEKRDILNCFRQIIKFSTDIGLKYYESTLSSLIKMKENMSKMQIAENTISKKVNDAFISDIDNYIEKIGKAMKQDIESCNNAPRCTQNAPD